MTNEKRTLILDYLNIYGQLRGRFAQAMENGSIKVYYLDGPSRLLMSDIQLVSLYDVNRSLKDAGVAMKKATNDYRIAHQRFDEVVDGIYGLFISKLDGLIYGDEKESA